MNHGKSKQMQQGKDEKGIVRKVPGGKKLEARAGKLKAESRLSPR
jgi:hypothetical protein